MARKTKAGALETHSAILEAAVEVFLRDGVASASLESIAKEAGVTRGAVYWHFKNKIDIFTALHEQLSASFFDIILADLAMDDPAPLKQLEALCVKLLVDLEEQPKKARILTVFFHKCDYSGELAQLLVKDEEHKARSTDLFIQYFERAIAKGHMPADANPRTFVLGLHCYLVGICYEYLGAPDEFSMQEQAAPLMRLFFNRAPA